MGGGRSGRVRGGEGKEKVGLEREERWRKKRDYQGQGGERGGRRRGRRRIGGGREDKFVRMERSGEIRKQNI